VWVGSGLVTLQQLSKHTDSEKGRTGDEFQMLPEIDLETRKDKILPSNSVKRRSSIRLIHGKEKVTFAGSHDHGLARAT
jgi:hypothetical protein